MSKSKIIGSKNNLKKDRNYGKAWLKGKDGIASGEMGSIEEPQA